MSKSTMVHHHAAVSIPFDGTGNRRSACDRCRSHKLRCERGPDASQCRRCSKAEAECVTGATLKSGRPQQLYTMQRPHGSLGHENHLEGHAHLSHRPASPDILTPPPSTFHPPFEAIPTYRDGVLDMQLLAYPGSFDGFDEIWMNSFEQNTTTASSVQPVASVNGNGDVASFDPPSDMRAECLKKLRNLQSNVLADLERVKLCRTADKCAQTATISESGKSHNFLVGRMLDHSEVLIEILDCFEPAVKDKPYPTNEHGSRIVQAPLKSLRCDAPIMFSLLSCYVCLTRIYRTIFSCIHDSMPFLSGSKQPVPQLFPGMHLGGFKLEGRLDLQVQILVRVSEDMLGKIEAKFGITKSSVVASESIFEHGKAAKMLCTMLEEEASEQPQLDEKRGDCESLRNILASLKHMIQMEGVSRNG